MDVTEVDNRERELEAENERLRARMTALEQELVEIQARADAQVALLQERIYWLDRWHLDLNALMRRPAAPRVLDAVRALRAIYWQLKRAKRRLRER